MNWTGVYLRLSWRTPDVDAFIADRMAPALSRYREAGQIADWYYLRYWETGPHLRVRVRDAERATVGKIIAELRDLIAADPSDVQEIDPDEYYAGFGVRDAPWYPHGDVREVAYQPETARYGGADALPIAEDLFCRSTEIAVAVLRAARSASAKLTAAIELTMATTSALDLDRPAAAAWLRTVGASWRVAMEPTPPPSLTSHVTAHQILAARGGELAQRWHREPRGATAHWIDRVRAARARSTGPMPHVWASQLHMLLNRLGIGPNEERAICWLVAATALSPDGLSAFHDDGATAADRRYVEASKFLPGFDDQLPRKDILEQVRPVLPWHRTVELPDPSPVDASLVTAMKARRTGRTFSGSLDTGQLATLLWTAQAPEGNHRPYPSAGAKYCARLRLIALNVTGLEPGCYEVDPVARTLLRLGPEPSIPDLERTSMWFGAGATELSGTPAVLGLYARIGALRATYGMRALRFAFAEAGHLAQNLGLVAAALGMPMGLVGGFYDDLAHDVLGLDGVNDSLVYLMPLCANAV